MMFQLVRLILSRLKSLASEPSVTVEFPFVVKQVPHGTRTSLRNNFAECIGCLKCEVVCPVHCISITSEEFPSKEKAPKTSRGVVFERRVTGYKIDFNQCVNCGLCVEICNNPLIPRGKPAHKPFFCLSSSSTLLKTPPLFSGR